MDCVVLEVEVDADRSRIPYYEVSNNMQKVKTYLQIVKAGRGKNSLD